MKAGDLRRFNSNIAVETCEVLIRGKTFLVLDVAGPFRRWDPFVRVLVDGKVLGPWGLPWVRENSEVIDEAG